MNEIISVPNYDAKTLKYLVRVILFINGKIRESGQKPIYLSWAGTPKEKKQMKLFTAKLYSDFIYDSYAYGIDMDLIIRAQPFQCYKNLKKKFPNLNFDKFTERKTQIVENPIFPFYNFEDYKFVIEYLEVREAIIPYLENFIDKNDNDLIELKKLFETVSSSNNLEFEEFLEKKASYLANLDLSNFVDELNKKVKK